MSNFKHGDKNTKLHRMWSSMKRRCYNPNVERYENYGGRGITVCNEWLDYISFKNWAIKNGYKEHLELDRKDNDGNYEPNNCRFVTQKQNIYNRGKRKNTSSQFKGVSLVYNKWRAYIRKDGKLYNLGSFDDEKLAAKAYNDKAIELFGEYANLNKI